jgi:hypothetical protein
MSARRELQLTVIPSKLSFKDMFTQKCIYMLHDLFDAQKNQCCVLFANQEWIVWDFQYEPPIFEGDEFQLSDAFPVFANVYQVRVTMKGNQSFLKCNC